MSRREALLAGVALVTGVPLAALAKGGDSPKISIFGVRGASSPFDAGFQTGGKVLYSELGDEEVAIYKRIVKDSTARIEGTNDAIKTKSWQDIRARIRLEASELRTVQSIINDAIDDKATNKAAQKALGRFKVSLEGFDQACIEKNQNDAYKKYNATMKDLAAWQEVVGLSS